MRRSNFRHPEDTGTYWEVKQHLGRHLANLILESDTVLYKQWFKERDNVVADSLSRDDYYLSNKSHERFLSLTVPQQLPTNFRIKPLPREICFFMTAKDARNTATVESIKTKRSSAWQHWNSYLHSIGFDDIYLVKFDLSHKNDIIAGFSQAVRVGTFSPSNIGYLVGETVSTTIAHVTQTFRANNRNDPRLDSDGKTCFILQEQYRGYKNQNGPKRKQKALPMIAVRKVKEIANSHKDHVVECLIIGAIFFAMRSCEYLRTNH